MTDLGPLEFIKLAIYYASYLYFPAAAYLLFLTLKSRRVKAVLCMATFLMLTVLAYARFVEPRMLTVKEHDVAISRCFPKASFIRLAVFSDTHNGLFGNAMGIDRIASRVESLSPDAVLIAGDFVYFLHPDWMDQTFAAFRKITAPVIGVLGNHDVGLPGPDLTKPLLKSLKKNGVTVIDDQSIFLTRSGQRIELVGVSDLWADNQKLDLLKPPTQIPRLVLTHNPATIQHVSSKATVDLLIAGHTHGAQIYLPFFSCKLVAFACRINRYGLSQEKRAQVFVTSGTGMVGLPMRFNVPPRIDVLNVKFPSCDSNN